MARIEMLPRTEARELLADVDRRWLRPLLTVVSLAVALSGIIVVLLSSQFATKRDVERLENKIDHITDLLIKRQ